MRAAHSERFMGSSPPRRRGEPRTLPAKPPAILVKTTLSPRGLVVKIALGVGAENLGADLLDALAHNELEPEMLPALLGDLQAMAARAAL
jgi:hypothetical protein